jgi:hypothetical protein
MCYKETVNEEPERPLDKLPSKLDSVANGPAPIIIKICLVSLAEELYSCCESNSKNGLLIWRGCPIEIINNVTRAVEPYSNQSTSVYNNSRT